MRYPETASIIRSARLRKGLSQERAAIAVGCSRLQFIRWEQGIHKPNPAGFGARLAEILALDGAALSAADGEDDEEAASTTSQPREVLEALYAALGIALNKNPEETEA